MGRRTQRPFDWWLFALLVILAIGLVMVLSASGIVAEQVNGDKYSFFQASDLLCPGGRGGSLGVALYAAV